MTLTQNIVMRLLGLFIFLAPVRGAEFLGRLHVKTAKRLHAEGLL